MIVDKLVSVRIINHNMQHYIDIGMNVKYGDIIKLDPYLLTKGSHVKVKTSCDNCGKEGYTKFQDYIKVTKDLSREFYCTTCVKELRNKLTLLEKYGVDNASKSEISKERKKQTNIKNWGVENVFQSDIIKEKSKQTTLEKYGVEFINQSDIIKEKSKQTRIEKGHQISDDKLSEYEKYRRMVISETRKHIYKLYENWNGYDYYDNEYIKDYKKLNSNDNKYPCVDHKNSIYNGFVNNIDYKITGNIDNLCITKRSINSSKQSKNEKEFLMLL